MEGSDIVVEAYAKLMNVQKDDVQIVNETITYNDPVCASDEDIQRRRMQESPTPSPSEGSSNTSISSLQPSPEPTLNPSSASINPTLSPSSTSSNPTIAAIRYELKIDVLLVEENVNEAELTEIINEIVMNATEALVNTIEEIEAEKNISFIDYESNIYDTTISIEIENVYPPTSSPSSRPTFYPSSHPSSKPTSVPTYPKPTIKPTQEPIHESTQEPTREPTHEPATATQEPTYEPSINTSENYSSTTRNEENRALFGLFALLIIPASILGYYLGTRNSRERIAFNSAEPGTPIPSAPTPRQTYV